MGEETLWRLQTGVLTRQSCTCQSVVLQNCHFWSAKLPLLECKTHHFGMQNAPFWNAKRTVLECKTHRFRNHPHLLWNANSIQLDFRKSIIHSSSATYLSIELLRLCFLLLPLGRLGGAFILPSPPLGEAGWGLHSSSFGQVQRGFCL